MIDESGRERCVHSVVDAPAGALPVVASPATATPPENASVRRTVAATAVGFAIDRQYFCDAPHGI